MQWFNCTLNVIAYVEKEIKMEFCLCTKDNLLLQPYPLSSHKYIKGWVGQIEGSNASLIKN